MINLLAKSLVLVHTILSLLGMSIAIVMVLQARDLGWAEPYKETLPGPDGKPAGAIRYASEYDKSWAAAKEASRSRDRIYTRVQPAIDALRLAEPYLPNNHFVYLDEVRRLREAPEKIEVKRQQNGGAILETPGSKLGVPALEGKPVAMVTKSYQAYAADLKKLGQDTAGVEEQIRKIVNSTKALTFQLTGTDETNKYVQPGLYQLVDLEFKAQAQIRNGIDEIKPYWSKAVEQSRLFRYRRDDLEATLQKLKAPRKKEKKG